MINYYILAVNSLIKTFSVLDAGNTVNFCLTTQDSNGLFANIKPGDNILGYVGVPVNRVKYVFEVQNVDSSNQIELIKKYEVAEGASINNIELEREISVSEIIKIDNRIFREICKELLKAWMDDDSTVEFTEEKKDLESDRVSTGENVLLYGVPGAGKSWTIEHEYCDDEECVERLVFHPDYMYSDFVGQILPIVKKDDEGKEKVRYEFTPGPFTKIMKTAYENPTKSFYLVIEEINRGNAPAIFGEIFQLLDRKTEDDNKYKKCTSEYGITNSNIANEVYGDQNVKVRIPANLSIIGTMNTSDQNVFTLDTAFQRRWIMRMIPNSFSGHKFAKNKILDTDVSWQQFCEAINEEILRRNNVTSSEDKRLGAYFVSSDDLICKSIPDGYTEKEKINIQHMNARFAEKVLKYLWDDAFKFSHADTFDTKKYESLEKVVEGFNSSTANDRFKVFHENLRKMIIEGLDDNNMISDEDDN